MYVDTPLSMPPPGSSGLRMERVICPLRDIASPTDQKQGKLEETMVYPLSQSYQCRKNAPKRIRIAVYTLKGCHPRPLDDGGTRLKYSKDKAGGQCYN